MADDIALKSGIIIPAHELEITASRSGGPGGQHVNKTSSRITVRWNIKNSSALTDEQKARLFEKLASEVTAEGDILVNSSESRSQGANKKNAFDRLAHKVHKALLVPKKRMKTKVSKAAKDKALQAKKRHGEIKKLRKVSYD